MIISQHLQFAIIVLLSIQNTHGMQLSPKATKLTKAKILYKASTIRQKLNLDSNMPSNSCSSKNVGSKRALQCPSKKQLHFSSSYKQSYGHRGFCNWLIPGRVMIGQYPGQTPESNGPRKEEVEAHVDDIVNRARIRWFLSLQSEVPDQGDDQAWKKFEHKVRLPVGRGREEFPGYFSHYAPLARDTLTEKGSKIQFSHSPILDLDTPNSNSLLLLLSELLEFLEDSQEENDISKRSVYIHCWGGRGRAGLVGSCLLSLLFPEFNADTCLEWVQTGYDSRDGSQFMPMGLRRSPQTIDQRNFVRDFRKTF